MKNRFLQRRLAKLEAGAKIDAKVIEQRIAEALTKLTNAELDQFGRFLEQISAHPDASRLSEDVSVTARTVDELVAAWRSAIG